VENVWEEEQEKMEESDEQVREDESKDDKRLTSPICPLKRTHWNDGKRARGNRPRKI